MLRLVRMLAAAAVIAATPEAARAEVSDKIPSITWLWVEPVVYGCLAFLLTRWRWWLSLALLPLTLLLVIGSVEQVRDPSIGPAIWAEQGLPYVASVYGSVALFLAIQAAVVWLGVRLRSRPSEAAV